MKLPSEAETAEGQITLGAMGTSGLVLSCEHGGNQIPLPWQSLFAGCADLLNSHRGFDSGALEMAEDLAQAFAAPLVAATVSRLLVDLNRSVGHPRLHFEPLRRLPAEVRREMLQRYYRPYRDTAVALMRQAIAEHGRVIHVSCHSFTPELNGRVRQADIGLLYDPACSGEVDFCARWRATLQKCGPDLTIRRNYPYAGKGDGLTRWFRRHLPPNSYLGIELEINQKHVVSGNRPWFALRQIIIASLQQVFMNDRSPAR